MIFVITQHLALTVALLSIVYVLLLIRFPDAWLTIILAALPILDFAPWTGEFFIDEYDLLLSLTITTILIRRRGDGLPRWQTGWSTSANGLLICLGLSGMVSAVLGAYPFPALDVNAVNNYLSPYNAVRVAKGVGFAWLLMLLLAADLAKQPQKTLARLTLGFTLGILGASLAVIWERLSFTGLLNFDSGYRVVGLFSGMHTGGAYVEGYLVTGLPFVIWWEMQSRHWWLKLVAIVIFLLGCYALLVTYARGGYIAFMLSFLVLFLGLLWRNWSGFIKSHARSAVAVTLISFGGLLFAYMATPMHQRFQQLTYDRSLRLNHWEQILGLMDPRWQVQVFGEGLGRLPAMYAKRAAGDALSEYRFVTNQGHNVLELTGGDPLYYEQVVDVHPHQHYRLKLIARNQTVASELFLSLCRKWMLYAKQCEWYRVDLAPSSDWQTVEFDVRPEQISTLPWYVVPDIKLAIENDQAGSRVDIASVSLQTDGGIELVRNGDFAQGSRDWFFSTDNHLPWHFKNLLLQLYFEQGLVGLMLMSVLLVYSALTLLRRRLEPDYPAALYGAALTAFLTVGLIDSLFDFPRMSMIFYLLLMLIQYRHPQQAPGLDQHST